ncbi:E3 ubiquitin-protein ligase TRIM39-like [Engystomops pustulosus]|uniref:E3 ubiquitin-protein ligase TRIM39-like n=1 Tax=Engystomops pustulosus TaxID=76066 RepID=UPI003AFB6C64
MASADLVDELLCSICLSIYTDPVTLKCGHNFCRVCIVLHLNTQDGSGVYSCPECRATSWKRPALQRNITLRNVVERVRSTEPTQEKFTGVCCTYCIHSPVPAVKSCLHCEASLCDDHLRVHSKGPGHILLDPSTSLENRKCSVHQKILEYYCTEDAACICVTCRLDGEHRGHHVETLDEASEKKKKKLRDVLQKLTIKTQVTHIITTIKEELSRKMRHIEELCNMTDPLTVLQEPDTGDLCDPEEGGGDEDTGGHDGGDEDTGGHDGGDEDTGGHDGGDEDTGGHDRTHDKDVDVISSVDHDLMRLQPPSAQSLPSHTQDLLVSDIESQGDRIVRNAGIVEMVSPEEEVEIYGQGPAEILLDANTAYKNIHISDDLKCATWTHSTQICPDTTERFQDYDQVMSSRGFTSGRHYWEVEIHESLSWGVGMCYPSMERRGGQSFVEHSNKSWSLCGGRMFNNYCSVTHNYEKYPLPHQISSNRFRISLDYEAGELSFYELCDPIRHLHTFTTTFTEPLYAVIYVWEGYIKILKRVDNVGTFTSHPQHSPGTVQRLFGLTPSLRRSIVNRGPRPFHRVQNRP